MIDDKIHTVQDYNVMNNFPIIFALLCESAYSNKQPEDSFSDVRLKRK